MPHYLGAEFGFVSLAPPMGFKSDRSRVFLRTFISAIVKDTKMKSAKIIFLEKIIFEMLTNVVLSSE